MTSPTTSTSTSASASTKTTSKRNDSDGPPTERWRVRASHPRDNKRVLFSTISESRARRFMSNRFPRGSEAYLEAPDGTFESYEHERQGPYGEDVDQWAPFDPEAYVPPEEQLPPGESAWSDVES
jgi:hypothetical protein